MLPELVAAMVAAAGMFVYGMARREKTSPQRAMEHPLRALLLRHVRSRPGSQLAELWRAAGVARSTVQYHLFVLQRASRVYSVHQGGESRYFPSDDMNVEADALSILLRGRILDLVGLLIDHPGWCQQDFVQALNLRRKTFRQYADVLAGAKLLEERRDKFRKRYFPTERLMRVLPAVPKDKDAPESSCRAEEKS